MDGEIVTHNPKFGEFALFPLPYRKNSKAENLKFFRKKMPISPIYIV